MASEEYVLKAENLTKVYKSSGRGVQSLSLRIKPGEIYGLMGPNGSGKSTLLRMLSTAIKPDSGDFRVMGLLPATHQRAIRAKLGLMVDRPTHYNDLTGWANAYFFARAYGMEDGKAQRALNELFSYFGLSKYKDDKVKTYSYGMGKKLALIEALAHGPGLLLLDEPSLGLDYTSQLAYQRKVRKLARDGTAILLASNQVDEVETLCDRVSFLYGGKLIAEGTPEALISKLQGIKRISATLRNPVDYSPIERVPGVEDVVPEGSSLAIHCQDRPEIVADVVAAIVECGGDVVTLSVRQPNLEDVYEKLTGEALNND